MTPSRLNLADDSALDESPAYLYIDEQNIIIQHFWAIFGCVAPLLFFWGGVFLCAALTGW